MACLNSSHGGMLPGADHSQRSMLAVQIESPELEWYYPLLKPYEHYIPMVANESWVNLEEVIGWAEAHQEEVAKIVENATAFAIRYLSAQGRSVSMAPSVGADDFHSMQTRLPG